MGRNTLLRVQNFSSTRQCEYVQESHIIAIISQFHF